MTVPGALSTTPEGSLAKDDFELHGTQTGRFKTDVENPSAAPKEVARHEIIGNTHRTVVKDHGTFGDIVIACSCGAVWSHPMGTTDEKVQSVFQSHVAYAQRMATRPD